MGKDLNGKELGEGFRQRKDGTYSARFVNRFGKRQELYGATFKEVKNKLKNAQLEDARLSNVVNSKIILEEWYEKWFRVYKLPVIRRSSAMYYKYIYEYLIRPVIGSKKLVELTQIEVLNALTIAKEKGYGYEVLNKMKILMVDMLNRAMQDDFVNKNVARGVPLPIRRVGTRKIKALSIEDQEAFFECAAGTFYYPAYVVAINTGLRPGELFALTEKDIDFKRKTISVSKTLTYQPEEDGKQKEFRIGPPKTNASVREVPLNEAAEKALLKQRIIHQIISRKQIKKTNYPDLLFTTKFGTPLNIEIFNQSIKRIIEEVNLSRDTLDQIENFGGHTFRHTFATRCFEAGIQAKTVQAYLGHASLSMTMDLYTAVMPNYKKQEIQKLNIDIAPSDIKQYDIFKDGVLVG